MPIDSERRDIIPRTPTAAVLARATAAPAEARRPGDPQRREIDADPDAPNAPVCRPAKYITIDPDDPNAPTCKPKRYIVAPDPGTLENQALPDWARSFGAELSDSMRPPA